MSKQARGTAIPELDPVNDGRHRLRDLPLERESVPYVLTLPEHRICAFIYTWVNKDNLAGSIFVAYGPGVGEQPIVEAIDNVPMPAGADFDDWKVGCVHIRQDLKLQQAQIRVDSPRATLEARFEALHPAYAYGFHAEGCPDYAATNRLEQAGRMVGSLGIGGKSFAFDTTGARDHSWGTRDWQTPQHWKWLHAQGGGTCVHFWQISARGRTDLRGYLHRDGRMAEIETVEVDFEVDEQYRQRRISARVLDREGRSCTVRGEFFAHFPLLPGPHTTLIEGGLECRIDEAPGSGWVEFMWPTPYLEHLRGQSPAA
jgi:hypothetical protein